MSDTNFSMAVIDANEIAQVVKTDILASPEEVDLLRQQATTNALAIMECDMDSLTAKKKFTASIDQFGMENMQKSSNKNTLLKVSVGKLAQAGAEGGEVSRGLIDLQREIKGLDPSIVDFTEKGLLGKILNPVRTYFEKYEKAEGAIENIIQSLDKGKAILKNDNTTLAIEQQALRELSKKIAKEVEMAALMDEIISEKLEEEPLADAEKMRFIQEEILFPLRQRIMDMQQMAVVNQQGIIAMEVIQRNNKELMRGVDRAKTVTVSALRTAVMVASALYNQKIVLKKIQALNETTNNLIGATSRMLKEQGTDIHRQSIESTLSADTLRTAFEDIFTAIADISAFKQNALPVMQNSIQQFRELAERGEIEIQKLEKGSALSLSDGSM
ncbi:MAG: toxic anion resistance protein [Firmicutes bacterium]|nr:toxic anion resistance protein [Bacillota bacterium]